MNFTTTKFGYLISFKTADTIWVHNQPLEEHTLGSRDDIFFKFSRWYVRDLKCYVYEVIIWKLNLKWVKV
jgi:hypothetical protein